MRVRDIKSEELRQRVEAEQAFICQKEFSPENPSIEVINRGLPEGDGFISLPKDQSVTIDVSLDEGGSMVLPSAVLERLIRTAAHRVIINFCLCRDGMECRDYPIDWGCIFLGEAAKAISPELGRAVGVEEALEYAAKCREAGLVHMVGRFSGDLRWLNPGVGPSDRLVTVCNCCSCCCGMRSIPFVRPDLREQTFARMPGLEIEVGDSCGGCGLCVDACMVRGIELQDDKAVINERCRICGRCEDVCPNDAITITVTSSHYIEEAIADITSRVDVT